jgi:hypothetical protein
MRNSKMLFHRSYGTRQRLLFLRDIFSVHKIEQVYKETILKYGKRFVVREIIYAVAL